MLLAVVALLQDQLIRQHAIWRPYPKGPLVIAIFLPAYFLPTMLGFRSSRRWKIAAVNILLGWTLVGWVAAMLMAIRSPAEEPSESPSAG
ncbi:MAG: superinfection immunity protein [Gemmatimonadaceae bacterium]|jgi:thiosulfate reductase cytochrome b subunit|nr:superinfection immunity protein [Gemmatimonadaceae bacterium]